MSVIDKVSNTTVTQPVIINTLNRIEFAAASNQVLNGEK